MKPGPLSFAAALLAAIFASACGRVPEASLRDEQARSRKYRDAYETMSQENDALKKRLGDAEKRAQACADTPPSAPAKSQ